MAFAASLPDLCKPTRTLEPVVKQRALKTNMFRQQIETYLDTSITHTPGLMNSLFRDFFKDFWRGILSVFGTK